MTRLRGAALALLCFAVVGCGVTGPPQAAQSPSSSPRPTSPGPSGSPTSDAVPAGMRRLTAKASGLSFAIPGSWTVIDATKFNDPRYRPFFRKYAAGHHLTLEQFHAILQQVDLMAMAPVATARFATNVNVELLPLAAQIPTPESLRAQFQAINTRVLEITDVDTPVGRGRRITFDGGAVLGSVRAYGIALFVRVDNGIAGLTVSTGRLADASSILARILPTLRDRGTSTANKA